MMTVLIHDARNDLIDTIGDSANNVHEILFADDTLIVDEDGTLAESHLHCIQHQGACYGLKLNCDKLAMMYQLQSINFETRRRHHMQ